MTLEKSVEVMSVGKREELYIRLDGNDIDHTKRKDTWTRGVGCATQNASRSERMDKSI